MQARRKNSRRSGRAISLPMIMKKAKSGIRGLKKNQNVKDLARKALLSIGKIQNPQKILKRLKYRTIKVPKIGGILPLIPLFAGLSALGALSGGAAGVAKAINDTKSAQKTLEETKRHNQAMEAAAVPVGGKGFYLRPYKRGFGISYSKNY